jgi:hypothetical protein
MEPFSYSAVYGAIHGRDAVHQEAHMTQLMITNTLELVSFACNFVFYCAFLKPFQKTLKSMVKRCSKDSAAIADASSDC